MSRPSYEPTETATQWGLDVTDILVVEDHLVVAEALSVLMDNEPDMRVVGTAGSAEEGIRLARARRPHVVLMDYQLPDGTGTSAAKEIVALVPGVAVIILTATATESVLMEAMSAGCKGFIGKGDGLRTVLDTVRAVRAGEVRFNAKVVPRSPGEVPLRPLAPREREILRLLAAGASTNAISEELMLSSHTVRNHIRHILAKLGAHSKLEAVAIATRNGLVTHSPSGDADRGPRPESSEPRPSEP